MFGISIDRKRTDKAFEIVKGNLYKKSVDDVLESGYFTKDLSQNDYITTNEMGDKILESIKKLC